ncbi:jg20489 [Pararge aegeria aegeria]|uniref:Jg20489 protein n=1 Tax=Pararge aegeria aegeria TaxID=348720 RepID=A0A8S4RUM5_9NEOP|nr:jg20489 [Pararge aegeria aegeria]
MFCLSCSKQRAQTAPASAPVGDAHASLMAAIRQAGGVGRAKLKPAADTVAENTGSIAPLYGDGEPLEQVISRAGITAPFPQSAPNLLDKTLSATSCLYRQRDEEVAVQK